MATPNYGRLTRVSVSGIGNYLKYVKACNWYTNDAFEFNDFGTKANYNLFKFKCLENMLKDKFVYRVVNQNYFRENFLGWFIYVFVSLAS